MRADRINFSEPDPETRLLSCPEQLSPGAQEVWRRLAPDLQRRGVLTAWDVEVFAIFCDLVEQAHGAREVLGIGVLVRGRETTLVTNPAWRIYRDMISEIRGLAQEFGLTPSARSSLKVLGLPDVSPPPEPSDSQK